MSYITIGVAIVIYKGLDGAERAILALNNKSVPGVSVRLYVTFANETCNRLGLGLSSREKLVFGGGTSKTGGGTSETEGGTSETGGGTSELASADINTSAVAAQPTAGRLSEHAFYGRCATSPCRHTHRSD